MMSTRGPRVQVATTREGVTMTDPVTGRRGARRVRQVVNALTLATPLGLLLAHVGGATLRPGPHGTLVAAGYRSRFPAPRASAVTIGDVVLLRLDDDQLARRPQLLEHEARHATQWSVGLGLVGFPLAYAVAAGWSWLRCGDGARRNVFERAAGLAAGGYLPAATPPGQPSSQPEQSARVVSPRSQPE